MSGSPLLPLLIAACLFLHCWAPGMRDLLLPTPPFTQFSLHCRREGRSPSHTCSSIGHSTTTSSGDQLLGSPEDSDDIEVESLLLITVMLVTEWADFKMSAWKTGKQQPIMMAISRIIPIRGAHMLKIHAIVGFPLKNLKIVSHGL